MQAVRESTTPYRGNTMQEAKAALDSVKAEVLAQIDPERGRAVETITVALEKLKSSADFSKLTLQQQSDITAPLDALLRKVGGDRFIGNIREAAFSADQELYSQQLEQLLSLAHPPQPQPDGNDEKPAPRRIIVRKDSVKVFYSKPVLETAEDLDEYLAALRIQYLKIIIEENKQIAL